MDQEQPAGIAVNQIEIKEFRVKEAEGGFIVFPKNFRDKQIVVTSLEQVIEKLKETFNS